MTNRFCRLGRDGAPVAQRVAVVGASEDPAKYGHKAVKAYQRAGWDVVAIHPTAKTIAGARAYPRLTAAPQPIHRVTLYLPPALGLTILEDVAAVGPEEFFVNPGADSDALLARARQLGLEPIQACSIIEVGVRPDDV